MTHTDTNSAAGTVNSCTTEPTTAPNTAFTDFILAQLNCASLRSKIITNQIEAATVALSAGMITPETALLILHETGLAGLIPTSSAPAIKVSA